MIRRIQTLYLAVAAGACAWFLLSGLPQASGILWQTVVICCLGAAAAGLCIVALLKHRNRQEQARLINAAIAVSLVFSLVAYYSLYTSDNLYFRTVAGVDVPRLLALCTPIVAYVGMRLARAGVRRDIRLVQSADRLR